MNSLLDEISAFYRQWHALEASLGSDGGLVIDFDYCPVGSGSSGGRLPSRLEALRVLEALQRRLADSPETNFSNKEFLVWKLKGANSYLRALSGERIAYRDYFYATMGVVPEMVPAEEIAALRAAAQERIGGLGLRWAADEVERYNAATAYPDPRAFGDRLREYARTWVGRTKDRIGLTVEPRYRIETAEEDAYWLNWIDGRLGEDILLRVNLHPRLTMRKGQDEILAAHEIAGHALHILTLNESREAGKIESVLMNTTVHSCETFQMEGLAQTVMHLIAAEGEVSDQIGLQEAMSRYHQAVINNAHLAVEDGAKVDEVIQSTLKEAPFLPGTQLASDIRDRRRNPLFRAYVAVYYPSAVTFLRLLNLEFPERRRFLREMYSAFWTPAQIQQRISEYGG